MITNVAPGVPGAEPVGRPGRAPAPGLTRLQRGLLKRLSRAIARWPLVAVEGGRGAGKTFLAEDLVTAGHAADMISLADLVVARRARDDLDGFVASLPHRCVIDDIHLLPELGDALVAAAERASDPGQFIVIGMAGSFPPHLLRSNAVHLLRLRPFTQTELSGTGGGFVDAAQSTDPTTWSFELLSPADYFTRAVIGGQPQAATLTTDERARLYLDQARLTVAGFGDAHRSELLARLSEAALYDRAPGFAPTSVAGLPGPAGLSPSGGDAVGAGDGREHSDGPGSQAKLEREGRAETAGAPDPDQDPLVVLGLTRALRRWSSGVPGRGLARHVITDSGLLNALSVGVLAPAHHDGAGHFGPAPGRLISAMAVNEILTQNEWRRYPAVPWRWEARPGSIEIDLLLEDNTGGIVAIAVDPGTELGTAAPAALEAFARRYPKAFRRGFVLYCGSRVLRLGEGRWAVPLSAIWSDQSVTPIADIGSLEMELSAAAAALSRLLRAPRLSDAELDRRAGDILHAVHSVIAPKLTTVQRAVEGVGLAVAPVPETGLDGPLGMLLKVVSQPPVRQPSGCGLRIGSPPGPQWTAVIAGFVQPDGQAQWWAGHVDVGCNEAVQVGPTVVASAMEDDIGDRLVAALAASLTDAYARFS